MLRAAIGSLVDWASPGPASRYLATVAQHSRSPVANPHMWAARMANVSPRQLLLRGRPGWSVPPHVLDTLVPLFWLVAGLLLSYLYLHGASIWDLQSPQLPLPLFPPQAVILSVLLVTPIRRWWLYLLA